MKEARAVGISLWLVLDGEERRPFAARIRELAERLGTPAFEPHVTLLGGLTGAEPPILDGARGLAAELSPLPIRTTGVDGDDEYFRCLFVGVAEDPALTAAHRRARQRFPQPAQPGYRPHLSLVYGELSAAQRDHLRQETGDGLPQSFVVTTLQAVRTEGPLSAWQPLAKWPLLGPG